MKSIFLFFRHIYINGTLPRVERFANSRLGQVASKGWLGHVWHVILKLVEFSIRYLRDNTFKGNISDFKLIYSFWKRDWLGRVELLLISVSALVVPTVLILGKDANQSTISSPVLIVGLAILTLSYAFTYAAAWYLPLWSYVLLESYLLYFITTAGLSQAFTPYMALPPFWLLFTTCLKVRSDLGRIKYLWLALVCWIVSYHTIGAFGLDIILPKAYIWVSVTLLGLFYFAPTALLLWIKRKTLPKFHPGPSFFFAGTILVTGVFYTLAVLKDFQATNDNVLLSTTALLWIVDLIWFWLGATTIRSTTKAGSWWTNESIGLLTKQIARWLIPIIWILTAFLGWLFTITNDPNVLTILDRLGLLRWSFSWDNGFYFSLQFQIYVSVAALLCIGLSLLSRRCNDTFLGVASAVWVAIFLANLAYYKKLQIPANVSSNTSLSSNWWLALTFVVSVVWQIVKGIEGSRKAETPARHFSTAALLGLLLATSTLTLGANSMEVAKESNVYSFMGVVCLGTPLLAFEVIQKMGYQPFESKKLVILVIIGEATALIPLVINPVGDVSLALPPMLWLLILFFWGKRLARFSTWRDAALAGCALGLGFITFWIYPLVISYPGYLQVFANIQNNYLNITKQMNGLHPIYQEGQLWLTLAALGIGLSLGIVAFFANRRLIPDKLEIEKPIRLDG